METSDLLLDAVEDYVARSLTPLAQKILELERKLAEATARPGPPGPAGADGRDGVDGKDGQNGATGPQGVPGEPGTPGAAGERGLDGSKGDTGDSGPAGPAGEIGPAGEKGLPGDSVHPDTVRVMVDAAAEVAVTKAIALLPKPENGRDADPAHTANLVEAAVARQFEILRPHIKGERGAAGVGLDGVTVSYDEQTGIAAFMLDQRVLGEIKGLPHDGGLFQRGKTYHKGAFVTYGGSTFVAQADTVAPIGGHPPSKDWRLTVQRGRDSR